MKNLLFMLLIFISISAMSQTRPPIVTNEIRTNLIKWNDLLMYRDSLVYFRPVSETSFQVKRPSSSVWSTYDFTEIPDSFFIPDLDIWIVVGQPITQGDSTFYVRQKPSCPNCWQYSYNNTSWLNWFCSETGASNLLIYRNADDILGIHYNKGIGTYHDDLYFKTIEADSGKVPVIVGDSVLWRDIPRDSLFDAYSSDWLISDLDTIPIQKDSIFYGNEWQTGNVIVINDTSKMNELDTIIINGQKLGNLDSIEVDPSVTNELDSIFVFNIIGSKWRKNGDSVNIYFPYLDGVDPQMQPFDGDILTYNYNEDYWTSTTSQRDTLIINGVKYGHLDSIKIDTCLWKYKEGIFNDYIISNKNVVVGDEGAVGAWFSVVKEENTFPLVYFRQGGTAKIVSINNATNEKFSIENDGRMISNGITYPTTDGDSSFVMSTDGNGNLSFQNPLWRNSGTGIRSNIDNVGIGINSDGHYGLSVQGIDYSPSLGLWHSGTGDFLQGRKSSSVIWNIDNDGRAIFPYLTAANLLYPETDGDSLGVMSTDGNGNLGFRNLTSENPPTYSGDSILALLTSGNGYSFWGRTSTDQGSEIYGDSVPYYQPYDVNVPIWCGTTSCGFVPIPEFNLKYQKIKSYDYILDSSKVWVQTNYGKWTPDTYGMNSDSLNVGIGEASKTATKLNVKALTGEKSAEFNGGDGVTIDKLTVGSGATITRSGTIASKDIWTGTAAEYSAGTVKDGVTPGIATTLSFIVK